MVVTLIDGGTLLEPDAATDTPQNCWQGMCQCLFLDGHPGCPLTVMNVLMCF